MVRSLRWLLLNEWYGKADNMTTWGAETTTVKARVDKHEITRSKGPDGNLYLLDGERFEAVGLKVPDSIARILNVTEDNFQEQLDPAFWFHLTSGQVARSLNKIVSLEAIDTSLDRVAVDLRQVREEIKVTEQRYAEAVQIKKSLDWTEDADADLRGIEQQETDIEEAIAGLSSLEQLTVDLIDLTRIRMNAADVIVAGQKAIHAGDEFFSLHNNLTRLQDQADGIERQERQIWQIKDNLEKAQKQMSQIEGSLCGRCHGTGRELR